MLMNIRSTAMGQIQSTQTGAAALFANPAGLADLGSWQLMSFYRYPFNLKELQTLALGVGIPGDLPIGITISQTGNTSYRNQHITVQAGKSWGPFSMGLGLSHWIVTIAGIGKDQNFSFDISTQMLLSPVLKTGAKLSNITQTTLFGRERLPANFQLGISYTPYDQFTIMLEIGSILGYPLEGKLGMEYVVLNKIPVRTGFNILQRSTHAGIGFHQSSVLIDYAVVIYQLLGFVHQAGLTLSWP